MQKIIYIHKRPYPFKSEFYPMDSDNYFFFGEGGMYIMEYRKWDTPPNIEFELWRGEVGVKHPKQKTVRQTKCRIFPASFFTSKIGTISVPLIRELRKECRKNNVIIHYTASPHSRELYLILLLIRNCKIYVTHQGGPNPYWIYKKTKNMFSYIAYKLEKMLYRRVEYINAVANSEIDYFKNIIKHKSVITSPHWGVNLNKYQPIDMELAREKLGLPLDKKLLLLAGGLSSYRGVKEAISTRNLLREKYNYTIELMNFGSTSKDEDYRYAEQNEVILLGYIDLSQVSFYFSAADVYLYLTNGEMNENFAGTGIAPLEALACNTPVVGNTLHHYPDIDFSGVGIYAQTPTQSAEAINYIFQNNTKYQNTRYIIEKHFIWSDIADKLLKNYQVSFKSLQTK